MGAKAYTSAEKTEAITLGAIIGADAAGQRLSIQPRTIRSWMARAGRKPADAITASDWASLGELARTKVLADLASGRVSTIQAATIAGIATRNAAIAAPPPEPLTLEEQWGDDLEAALLTHHKGHATLAMVVLIEWLPTLDPDGPAPTVPECLAYLDAIGDLTAWRKAQTERREREDAEQLAKNRQAAAEWTRKVLSEEDSALLAAAEAFLADRAKP